MTEVPCYPVVGDHTGAVVRWRGDADPRVPAGQPVGLHVQMRRAELFSLEWT